MSDSRFAAGAPTQPRRRSRSSRSPTGRVAEAPRMDPSDVVPRLLDLAALVVVSTEHVTGAAAKTTQARVPWRERVLPAEVRDVLCAYSTLSVTYSARESRVRVTRLLSGESVQTLQTMGQIVTVCGLSHHRIAAGTSVGLLVIWDLHTGERLASVNQSRLAGVTSIKELADGCIVTGALDCRVRVHWINREGDETRDMLTLGGHRAKVTCLVQLSSGLVLSGDTYGEVYVWDLARTQATHILKLHTEERASIYDMIVLPASDDLPERFATATKTGTIGVWNLPTPGATTAPSVHVLQGHNKGVTSLARMPTGELVSCGEDWSVRIWDPRTGTMLARLRGHRAQVACVRVMANGYIASSGYDNTLRIWAPNRFRRANSDPVAVQVKIQHYDMPVLQFNLTDP